MSSNKKDLETSKAKRLSGLQRRLCCGAGHEYGKTDLHKAIRRVDSPTLCCIFYPKRWQIIS